MTLNSVFIPVVANTFNHSAWDLCEFEASFVNRAN